MCGPQSSNASVRADAPSIQIAMKVTAAISIWEVRKSLSFAVNRTNMTVVVRVVGLRMRRSTPGQQLRLGIRESPNTFNSGRAQQATPPAKSLDSGEGPPIIQINRPIDQTIAADGVQFFVYLPSLFNISTSLNPLVDIYKLPFPCSNPLPLLAQLSHFPFKLCTSSSAEYYNNARQNLPQVPRLQPQHLLRN